MTRNNFRLARHPLGTSSHVVLSWAGKYFTHNAIAAFAHEGERIFGLRADAVERPLSDNRLNFPSEAYISDKLPALWIINYMAQLENFRLKVFRAVAEHLNFHDAAEHLFITQPAVTLQIKALENDIGVRLFDRARGGITLTRQGSVLLSYANKVAKLVAEAERELRRGNGQVSGELPLGVSTTIAQYALPKLLRAFLEEHPRIQFSLHSGNTSQVVQYLLDGRIPRS